MSRILPGKKVTAFGHTFDSKDEYQRYLELRRDEKFSDISELTVHPKFSLDVESPIKGVGKVHICDYTADFSYKDKHGELVVEDVKSLAIKKKRDRNGRLRTRRYGTATLERWKFVRKLMLACHGITVREILMNRSVRAIIQK